MKRISLEGAIKSFFSIMLFVFSVVAAIITGNVFVLLGMAASSTGDFNIMNSRGCLWAKADKKYFGWGMIAFSIAHLMYIFAMHGHKGWSVIVGLELLCCVLLILLIWGLSKSENFDALKSKIVQVVYAGCIILAAINAWMYHWVAGVGYIWFISSDLILSIYENKGPKYQIPIWAMYVPGEALIIASIILKEM